VFIPYRVDVPFDHPPVVNRVLVLVVIVIFTLQVVEVSQFIAQGGTMKEYMEKGILAQLILRGWGIKGIFGYMWLHGGPLHLLGNMIFLWLFGNAVCSKLGNLLYLPVYVGLGMIAAVTHLIFAGGSMIGASAAINGIVGMYLVFFPENSISCFFWLIYYPVWFSVSGYWIILLWFAFDVLGAIFSRGKLGGVAYHAHITGFLAGFVLAIIMLKKKYIVMLRDEKSLLELLGFEKRQIPEERRRDMAYWQQEWGKSKREKSGLETIPPEPEKPKQEFNQHRCLCGQKIKVDKENAGKIVRCPKCSTQWKVPEKSERTDMD